MHKEHFYTLTIKWTGNKGNGTYDYRSYDRSHIISTGNKPDILASSDPVFRGDKTKYNPEELLVASLASCHMLWFLHLCADTGIVVVDYIDNPEGILIETKNGGGKFKEVTLKPKVTVANKLMQANLPKIHKKANELCFIANSVNFPVFHKAVCNVAENN